jgi:hypothetical protein
MPGPRALLVAVVVGLCAFDAGARPAADDFLNPQEPGPRLTLMPFVGPGFRASYDHRFDLEEEVTELRTQLIGTLAVPFAEASANVDLRFFLMSIGASAGYHSEWHVLAFEPEGETGAEPAGAAPAPAIGGDPRPAFFDLSRDARVVKEEQTDVAEASWPFYEARWGFLWPVDHFLGVSTLAARYEARPDVSYDWDLGTVLNGGWHARWEGYALFRDAHVGFAGLALRALAVPRNRVPAAQTLGSGAIVPAESACQATNAEVLCVRRYEPELQYGVLAGLRPLWVGSMDVLLVRAYTTFGFDNELFGLHLFRAPLQLLVAYMVDIH